MKPNPDDQPRLSGHLFFLNLLGLGILILISLWVPVPGLAFPVMIVLSSGLAFLTWSIEMKRHRLAQWATKPGKPDITGSSQLMGVPKRPRFFPLFLIGQNIGLALAAITLCRLPTSIESLGILFAYCISGMFFSMVIWYFQTVSWRSSIAMHARRREILEYRRMVVRERERQNVTAQLSKPEFEDRLAAFVSNVDATQEPVSPDEPFISKAKFWQREPFGTPTPPRPIEYIRQLLHRLSKLLLKSEQRR